MKDISRALSKMIAPLNRRARLMVGRGILKLIKDTTKVQQVQVLMLADETHDDVERFAEYGFTSAPAVDAEAIVVCVGGERSHAIVIATEDRRYRPKGLAEGEVALYTKQNGKRVYLKSNGEVHLGADTENLGDDNLVALAKLVKDELTALRNTVNNFITTDYATHLHPSGMGPTGTPAVPASNTPAAVGDVKATKVKAK
jgi:phage baseplate assembly protein V